MPEDATPISPSSRITGTLEVTPDESEVETTARLEPICRGRVAVHYPYRQGV